MNLMHMAGKSFPKIGIVFTYFGRTVWNASVVVNGYDSNNAMVAPVVVSPAPVKTQP